MADVVTSSSPPKGATSDANRTGGPVRIQNLILQFCFAWVLIASSWLMLGTEHATAYWYRVQIIALAAGTCVSAWVWVSGCDWPARGKLMFAAILLLFALCTGANAFREYDAVAHILDPGRRQGDRIVHDAIGLSYSILPGSRVNARPLITKRLGEQDSHASDVLPRLKFGETAILSRMVLPVQPNESQRAPTSVIIEVQREHVKDLNQLFFNVRQQEKKWADIPNITITQHTRHSQIGGIDSVQFEFVEEPGHLMSRQVYFRSGQFVLNFMLNTDRDSERPLLEEFLKSVRLASGFGLY